MRIFPEKLATLEQNNSFHILIWDRAKTFFFQKNLRILNDQISKTMHRKRHSLQNIEQSTMFYDGA